jgi:hypothetical protein
MEKYEKPKEGSYTPQAGKPKYKIYEKIDTKKSLESIIEENIPNFITPSTSKEFIENLILIDYIISEKYKNNKSIFDEDVDFNNCPGLEALSLFFKSKNAKVYRDNSIKDELYKHLKKYYKSGNNFNKKIRISLNLRKEILQDQMTVESIIDKVINQLSKIIEVKNEDLHVVNVRKNCLLFDVFVLQPIRKSFSIVKYIVGKFNEMRFKSHKEEFKNFLREITNEHNNNNNFNFINERDESYPDEVVGEIKDVLNSYAISGTEMTPEKFDCSFDKSKGSFGYRIFRCPLKSIEKNGRTYYYPNKNCEGYGLKISDNIRRIIFDSKSDWCIVYTNILGNKAYFRINQFPGEYIEKLNEDTTITKFRLFFQCKIRNSSIIENLDGSLILDDSLVPYRLIKEHLD